MTSPPQPKDTTSQTFVLPSSSRTLGYATYGAPPSPTVPTILYFHGFPTSRLEAALCARVPFPLHIIAIDRPGIGISTFQPNRRIVDWPADVLALVDHLHIATFYVLGDSGGAPYALICAKKIPRTRLKGTAVVSGIYPLSLGTEGMLFGVKALLYIGQWMPLWLSMKFLDWEFGNAARNKDKSVFTNTFMKAMETRSERDRRCLDDLELRDIMIESMREGFRQGSEGAAWELGLYGNWEFELEDVDGKGVMLWHGKKDINAPFGMAEKAAKLMRGCELKVFEEETHLSLPVKHLEEIIRGLLKL